MSKKEPITASDLPSACRTWDDKRRVWVPKARYASDREASLAVRKDPRLSAYRCKASKDPAHFHVGHTKGSRR